jgi:hypothetical protein
VVGIFPNDLTSVLSSLHPDSGIVEFELHFLGHLCGDDVFKGNESSCWNNELIIALLNKFIDLCFHFISFLELSLLKGRSSLLQVLNNFSV